MKRLAWLFLAVFCTALAQVQRVELPVVPEKTCSCCDEPGACGMPECGLPPAAMPSVYSAERPVVVARPSASQEASRAQVAVLVFWAAMLEPVALSSSSSVSVEPLLPTQVPLFKAHCAFLI